MYFTRHAESLGNVGHDIVDPYLTKTGQEQASQLSGHYDCVIISPLRRCIETLHYSQLTYDHIHITHHFRERIFSQKDSLLLEKCVAETDGEFWSRVENFQKELDDLRSKYDKVLLIGHVYYFNAFYMKQCTASPEHATVITLK